MGHKGDKNAEQVLENIWSRKLLDVLIQAGLIGALVVLC